MSVFHLSCLEDTVWSSAHLSLSLQCRSCAVGVSSGVGHSLSLLCSDQLWISVIVFTCCKKEAHWRTFYARKLLCHGRVFGMAVASRPFAEPLETMCDYEDLVHRSFCYMTLLSVCAHLCVHLHFRCHRISTEGESDPFCYLGKLNMNLQAPWIPASNSKWIWTRKVSKSWIILINRLVFSDWGFRKNSWMQMYAWLR